MAQIFEQPPRLKISPRQRHIFHFRKKTHGLPAAIAAYARMFDAAESGTKMLTLPVKSFLPKFVLQTFYMPTTFAERKLHTIELLTKLENEELLLLIEQLLSGGGEKDWADDLTEAERLSIQKGLDQLNAGEGEDLDSFKKRMQSKYA